MTHVTVAYVAEECMSPELVSFMQYLDMAPTIESTTVAAAAAAAVGAHLSSQRSMPVFLCLSLYVCTSAILSVSVRLSVSVCLYLAVCLSVPRVVYVTL